MNPKSEWFKRNTQSESIRRIPTSDSWGLKDWSGFIRIQSLGLTRIETNWFLTELHQMRFKTSSGLTRMSSDWRGNRFRDKSDWFGMNFNPKLTRVMSAPFQDHGKSASFYGRTLTKSQSFRNSRLNHNKVIKVLHIIYKIVLIILLINNIQIVNTN